MANFNLNYLQKDELTYELLIRGQEPSDNSVESLRKSLRKYLKVNPDVSNLNGKISLKTEFETIKSKITFIEVLIDQSSENASKLHIAKLNAKLNHLQLRLGNQLEDEGYKKQLSDMLSELESLSNKFLSIKDKIPDEDLKQFEEQLNLSLIEEENENEKFEKCLLTATTSSPIVKQTPNLDKAMTSTENVNMYIPANTDTQRVVCTPLNTSVFNKLPNPIETYLNKFSTVCNGLAVKELLIFLRNLHELRTQTCLTQNELYEILPSYTAPPLLQQVLECKSTSKTLDELHSQIVTTFLPITLREKLKQDLVFRPQKPKEPLSIYVNEIKINSHLLLTNLSEQELVTLIKHGLSPEVRSKMVFENNPTTFKDLDQLCINVNNIQYNDYLRNKPDSQTTSSYSHSSQPNSNVYSPTTQSYVPLKEKTCFNCNRKGHIAKQCYRPTRPKNL
jgi:hypothetical protein